MCFRLITHNTINNQIIIRVYNIIIYIIVNLLFPYVMVIRIMIFQGYITTKQEIGT